MALPLIAEYILMGLAFAALCIVALWLFTRPFKALIRWLLSGIAGVVCLFLLQLLSSTFSFIPPLNVITIAASFLFGLPGLIVMMILQLLL